MSEYKLVPVDPSLGMVVAGLDVPIGDSRTELGHMSAQYRAMLAAAPTVSAEPFAYYEGDPLYKHPQATAVAEWRDIATARAKLEAATLDYMPHERMVALIEEVLDLLPTPPNGGV